MCPENIDVSTGILKLLQQFSNLFNMTAFIKPSQYTIINNSKIQHNGTQTNSAIETRFSTEDELGQETWYMGKWSQNSDYFYYNIHSGLYTPSLIWYSRSLLGTKTSSGEQVFYFKSTGQSHTLVNTAWQEENSGVHFRVAITYLQTYLPALKSYKEGRQNSTKERGHAKFPGAWWSDGRRNY